MTDAVIEIYDPTTNTLSVSAGLLSYVCRASGTASTQSRIGGNTNPSSLLIDITGYSAPFVALIMDGYGAAYSGQTGQNGRTYANYACEAPVGTTATWYVFEWSQSLPAHTAERQLWTADGRMTFSNRMWPMKLVCLIGEDENTDPSTGVSAASGSKLAHGTATMGGHSRCDNPYCADGGGGPEVGGDLTGCNNVVGQIDGKLYGGMTQSGGGTVLVRQVSYDDVTASFGSYNDYQTYYGDGWEVPTSLLVVDVAGIPVGATFF